MASERKSDKTAFKEFPTSVVDYMTMNEHPDSVFHSLSCRLAVEYGVDRNVINNDILHGTQTTTYQVLPGNIKPFSAYSAELATSFRSQMATPFHGFWPP